MRTSTITRGRNSLCALTTFLSQTCALFSPFPYSASQVCRKPQTLDWSYPVAIPGNPRVVFKPLPTACKERRREKLIDIRTPAATWHIRKSRKINVIHNLYNLTLARKPLGSTPSLKGNELPGWVWASCTRCQDWLEGNTPYFLISSDKERPSTL